MKNEPFRVAPNTVVASWTPARSSAPGATDVRTVNDLTALSKWAPEIAEVLVRLSSDIALVLGPDGLIEQVVQAGANPITSAADWVGRSWADTVTGETRIKIETMLKEVISTGVARRREVNHPGSAGLASDAIPMAYTAIRLGVDGPLVAVGRDLRAVAAIQQRFLEAQRESEKAYWRARQADSRYQLLFQVATDAMLLVDGETLDILEANNAAAQLFDLALDKLVGQTANFGFDKHSRAALDDLLTDARTSGKQAEVRVRLAGKLVHTGVAVTPFRVQGSMRLLVRVRVEHRPEMARLPANAKSDRPSEAIDAVVVTDSSGRMLSANASFLKLLLASSEEQIRNQSFQNWLGGGDSLQSIIDRVRSQGLVQRADSCVLQAGGRAVKIQISAALLTDDDQERIGFTLHPVQPALSAVEESAAPPPATFEILTDWLGTGALPALVQRASEIVERHLIAKALERTGGDAEASARLLGISGDELQKRRAAESPT